MITPPASSGRASTRAEDARERACASPHGYATTDERRRRSRPISVPASCHTANGSSASERHARRPPPSASPAGSSRYSAPSLGESSARNEGGSGSVVASAEPDERRERAALRTGGWPPAPRTDASRPGATVDREAAATRPRRMPAAQEERQREHEHLQPARARSRLGPLMPAPPSPRAVVAVVAVVEVEIAPAEIDVVDDGAEQMRVRLNELIAGAPDELARRVVALHDLHHAVDLARQHDRVGHRQHRRRVEDDEVVVPRAARSSIARMRGEPTSSAGFGGVGPAGMKSMSRGLERVARSCRARPGRRGSSTDPRSLAMPSARWQLGWRRSTSISSTREPASASVAARFSAAHRLALARRRAGDEHHLRRRVRASRTAPRCGARGTPRRPARAARAPPRSGVPSAVASAAPVPSPSACGAGERRASAKFGMVASVGQLEQLFHLLAALHAVVEVLADERRGEAPARPASEAERQVHAARAAGSAGAAPRRARRRGRWSARAPSSPRSPSAASAASRAACGAVVDVVLEQLVARAEVAEPTPPSRAGRASACSSPSRARAAASHSRTAAPSCAPRRRAGAATRLLLPELPTISRVVRAEAVARAPRCCALQVEQRRGELLDAGLVEEVRERSAVGLARGSRSGSASATRSPSALVSRLESSPIRCATIFCSWLTATFGCSVAKRASAASARSTLLFRLAHLPAEELLGGHVGRSRASSLASM